MSETKKTIEVDADFLDSLYGLVDKIPPGEKNINVDLLKDLILDIKRKMERIKTDASAGTSAPRGKHSGDNLLSSTDDNVEAENLKKVLIIDDLGVITYQLGVMFRNLGYEVTVAKEIYDAISKYKKTDFKLVIMDLFIPTDREGFLLLDELVKMVKISERNTTIGVMTASSKKEHRQLCMKKGADFYIEKVVDWQNELIEYCEKD